MAIRLHPDTPTPTEPEVLPGLAGQRLQWALRNQLVRLNFLAEHLDHPTVAQGVQDAILDARTAILNAAELHAAIVGYDAVWAEITQAVTPTEAHGYGDSSDCLCGRNFATVRGLREHLTKARAAGSES